MGSGQRPGRGGERARGGGAARRGAASVRVPMGAIPRDGFLWFFFSFPLFSARFPFSLAFIPLLFFFPLFISPFSSLLAFFYLLFPRFHHFSRFPFFLLSILSPFPPFSLFPFSSLLLLSFLFFSFFFSSLYLLLISFPFFLSFPFIFPPSPLSLFFFSHFFSFFSLIFSLITSSPPPPPRAPLSPPCSRCAPIAALLTVGRTRVGSMGSGWGSGLGWMGVTIPSYGPFAPRTHTGIPPPIAMLQDAGGSETSTVLCPVANVLQHGAGGETEAR